MLRPFCTKHLCVGQLHHLTLFLIQFHHSGMMHDLSVLKHLRVGALSYITLSLAQFQHSGVVTFVRRFPPPHQKVPKNERKHSSVATI